ncbi:MAG: spermidine synthase [Spirochaetaceae bacterium]|nr:MAG: spermidine synthase [Spirochaetaceae bacterium]
MSEQFAELGYQATPLGDLSLRRRRIFSLDRDVYEVKLGDEYLMSSLFTQSEEELGRIGVGAAIEAGLSGGAAAPALDVVVGGLGLGYTAAAVLGFLEVRSLLVVELFDAVIEWHRRGVVPLGERVSGDPRCRMIQDDFFARANSDAGFDPAAPMRRFDAILVDIDHTPDRLLDPVNAGFYSIDGLTRLKSHLAEGGIFGVWSDEGPSESFAAQLAAVFSTAEAHPVTFMNPLRGEQYTQTVYLARTH